MDQATNVSPLVLLAFNIVLGLASVFGGLWLKNMETSVRESRMEQRDQADKLLTTERQLREKLDSKVAKDEFREFREEQRQNFVRLFNGIDELKDRIAHKADRS